MRCVPGMCVIYSSDAITLSLRAGRGAGSNYRHPGIHTGALPLSYLGSAHLTIRYTPFFCQIPHRTSYASSAMFPPFPATLNAYIMRNMIQTVIARKGNDLTWALLIPHIHPFSIMHPS